MLHESLRTVLNGHHVHDIPSIAATETIAAAAALMKHRRVDTVMALSKGRFAGLFTARDVLMHMVAAGRNAETTRIIDAISTDPPPLDIDATIDQTLALMNKHGCQHVAVATGGGLLDVVSRRELTDWIIKSQQDELDCAIGAVKRMGYSNRRG